MDCGAVPERERVWTEDDAYWTDRKGGTCHPCHQEREAAQALREDQELLEVTRAAHAKRAPCWTCTGPLGGPFGSESELREQAPMRDAECPACAAVRKEENLGPLWLPLPTAKEWKLVGKNKLDDPWWEVRVLHAELCPVQKRP
ncbi:hypothetical protein [Kitasatospora sp. NPDC088346]|uniref:hypothetical protein n=1 Tax=Kitasatospora sp. NPDC088346 TaxID=3364073 RepID=UPI00382B3E74